MVLGVMVLTIIWKVTKPRWGRAGGSVVRVLGADLAPGSPGWAAPTRDMAGSALTSVSENLPADPCRGAQQVLATTLYIFFTFSV